MHRFKWLAVGSVVSALVGCASVVPVPLSQQELVGANQTDSVAVRHNAEPLDAPLTLNEALARALKYNLERRTRLMEEAIALKQLDVSKLDMLPKLMAQAGYTHANDERATYSSVYPNGVRSSTASWSHDPVHHTVDLGLTWNLIDLGLGYYGSKQQADRVLIASEKRRKAMHVLMQDVRTAYWRAASAQKLRGEVQQAIAMAESALQDARRAEQERLRNPLDALRYQRQLLENLRLLEAIEQELSTAQVELATLINTPLGQTIQIADTSPDLATKDALNQLPVSQLEEVALENNADLREQHYNGRIAREEVRRTLTRLFPNLSFSYGIKYDSDNYMVKNNWNEAGLQLSFNLFNLFTGDTQKKLAQTGVALADQRRMATQMAVLAQMHLARLQVFNARSQFARADAIYETDRRIAEQVRNRETVQAQSKLERVSNETTAILSLLRRYQALAQVYVAENRLIANLGLEPKVGSTDELSLAQLTEQLQRAGSPWGALQADGKGQ